MEFHELITEFDQSVFSGACQPAESCNDDLPLSFLNGGNHFSRHLSHWSDCIVFVEMELTHVVVELRSEITYVRN